MARDDNQQYGMPVRQNTAPGRLTRSLSSGGLGSDLWTASPFQMMRRMQEDMDRVFGSFFGLPAQNWGGGSTTQGLAAWSPTVDVYETEKDLVIKADVPGVEPEDLEVYCTDDALVLRGETRREEERDEGGSHRTERSYGRFERMIPLPQGMRTNEAKANFRNGVLELRIPKSDEVQQRMRRIPIGGAAGAKGGEAGSAATNQASQGAQAGEAAANQKQPKK
jgi:HSP20 family protein